jgi:hypothetical protein
MDVTRNPVTRAIAFPCESTVIPGASETVLVLDSTRMKTPSAMPTAAVSGASSYLAPGPDRGQFVGMIVSLVVSPVGQPVTVRLQSRVGATGTSSDWQSDDGGDITAAADSHTPIQWEPAGNDWRVIVVAGGTPPSSLLVSASYRPVLMGTGRVIQVSNVTNTSTVVSASLTAKALALDPLVWDDLRNPATAINPPGAASDPVRNQSDGWLEFSASQTNTIVVDVQLPHAYKEGSTIRPHVHWHKKTAGAGDVLWRCEYAFWNIGAAVPNSYTTVDVSTPIPAFPDDGTVKSLITSWGDVTMTGKRISCLGKMIVSRVGGAPADTYAGLAVMEYVDIHYQLDTAGSVLETTK